MTYPALQNNPPMIDDIVEKLPDTRLGKYIANQMIRSGTSPALNYGEAMKSTATLTAAGFNKTMILEMGTAARQASAAWGHNFEDAFNRITKGIQKAEPELLDELGIILRLDEATRKYAIETEKARFDLLVYESMKSALAKVERKKVYDFIDEKIELPKPSIIKSETLEELTKISEVISVIEVPKISNLKYKIDFDDKTQDYIDLLSDLDTISLLAPKKYNHKDDVYFLDNEAQIIKKDLKEMEHDIIHIEDKHEYMMFFKNKKLASNHPKIVSKLKHRGQNYKFNWNIN